VGKTFLVATEAVIRFLRDPRRRSAAEVETGRFERVSAALGQARRDLQRRRMPIPVEPETLRLEISGLPEGISLEPAQLTIRFDRPMQLLERLFALSQALANDYESFERSCLAAKMAGTAQ